jgi:hypothetical protein
VTAAPEHRRPLALQLRRRTLDGHLPQDRDQRHVYVVPATLELNHWAPGGVWTVESGAALSNRPNGRLAYKFHAREGSLSGGAFVRRIAHCLKSTGRSR